MPRTRVYLCRRYACQEPSRCPVFGRRVASFRSFFPAPGAPRFLEQCEMSVNSEDFIVGGMVPEQEGEIPTERAELGDEPRCLSGQGNGGRTTTAPYQGVTSSTTPDGEQHGVVGGCSCHYPGEGPELLRRLLAYNIPALHGTIGRDHWLSWLYPERWRPRKRRPGKRRPAAVPPSSGRHPPRRLRRNRRPRLEHPETASASLRVNVSNACEYVTSSSEFASSESEDVIRSRKF